MRNNIRNIGKANSAVACHETSHSSSHAADTTSVTDCFH